MTESVRGRPRSEIVRRGILAATRELLEQSGYDNLTIQGIAARSGSGRQTIYRWWTSKALIVADLVIEGLVTLPAQAVPDTGSLTADLSSWLDAVTKELTTDRSASVMRALITAASESQVEAQVLYRMTTGPFHEGLVARLAEGKLLGQIRPDVSENAIADALIGTALFRALTPGAEPAATDSVIDALIGNDSSERISG